MKVPQHRKWYTRPSAKGCSCSRSAAQVPLTGGSSVPDWTVWLHQFQYCSLTLVWAGNDLGRCEPTNLQEAVQSVVACASDWDVKLRLVDVVGGRYQHL